MSVEYLTNDTDLKKVADAIRAKGETTDLLTFPDGFVTAIQNIKTAPKIDPVFANNDWGTIISACASGDVPDTWTVGKNKTMTINGTDYQIDIIGKNHDDYADGSGKAPLTLMLHTSYAQTAYMNPSKTSNDWINSYMRKTYLPNILSLMPNEVQTGIKEVNKVTGKGSGSEETTVSSEKLFLLSGKEVIDDLSNNQTPGEGTQYEYFTSDINNRCNAKIASTRDPSWWLRSPTRSTGGASDYYGFLTMYKDINNSNADLSYDNCNESHGVSFAFCF